MGIAQIIMRIVRDGLHWGNAPKIQSTWRELLRFPDTVGGAVMFVNSLISCFPLNNYLLFVVRCIIPLFFPFFIFPQNFGRSVL
jgi:hypothetical protein